MALLSSIRKDVKWRLSDSAALVMWLGIPVLVGGLIGLVFGGRGVELKAKLLVADRDDTLLTRALSGASGGDSIVEIEKVEPDEGRRRLEAGDGSGLIVIPDGFTRAVINDQPFELELITNPSQTILPRILEEGLKMGVDASFYLQRVAGDLIRELNQRPPDGETFFNSIAVAVMSVKINERLKMFEGLLFPPVLSVEDELTPSQASRGSEARAAPRFNLGRLLLPGIIFMAVLFIAQGVTYDVWREKDLGTLSRLLCSPTGAGTFLLSKLIAGTIVIGAVALVGLLVGYAAFDVPFSTVPGALLWISFAGVSLLALLFVVQMLATSSRGANVLSSVLVFPLMMFGGSFIPLDSMPRFMAAAGALTPNGLAVVQLHAILRGQVDPSALGVTALELGAATVILFGLAVYLLRVRMAAR